DAFTGYRDEFVGVTSSSEALSQVLKFLLENIRVSAVASNPDHFTTPWHLLGETLGCGDPSRAGLRDGESFGGVQQQPARGGIPCGAHYLPLPCFPFTWRVRDTLRVELRGSPSEYIKRVFVLFEAPNPPRFVMLMSSDITAEIKVPRSEYKPVPSGGREEERPGAWKRAQQPGPGSDTEEQLCKHTERAPAAHLHCGDSSTLAETSPPNCGESGVVGRDRPALHTKVRAQGGRTVSGGLKVMYPKQEDWQLTGGSPASLL
ncbi:hypothetical protein NDU88_008324, partial [Pleurodeles waltl]